MQIEKKDNYTLITFKEASFSSLYNSFLEVEKELKKEHLVLVFSDETKIKNDELMLFVNISEDKKKNGTSFVVICTTLNVDDFPENFNIAPTLIEAEDIIEMEAIERELGF